MIIRNVTVIDGSGHSPQPGMEILIKGDKIAEVRKTTVQNDPEIIDGKGGFLIPGLWEAHTHLHIHGHFSKNEEVDILEKRLQSYLRSGITTVVDLGGSLETLSAVRNRLAIAPSQSSNLYYAGPVFTGINGWPLCFHHDHSKALEPKSAVAARDMVLDLKGKTNFIKCIYDGVVEIDDKLPKDVLNAIVKTAHEIGVRAIVHVKSKNDIVDAIEAGADCIEHSFIPKNFDDMSEAESAASLLAKSKTYYCPTLAVWEQIGRSGDLTYLEELKSAKIITEAESAAIKIDPLFGRSFPRHSSEECQKRFEYGLKSIPIMRAAGVKIVAGSDIALTMPPPRALLRELQLLSKAGLSNHEVLLAATRYAAERTGVGSGTIAPGASADAVLLSVDPLIDLQVLVDSQFHLGIMRAGKFHTQY